MQSALAVYGSDRSDQWTGDNIALGIQLARLVPEDQFDRQPLTSEDGRFILVADVRIDNRKELAEVLGIPRDRLRLMADADLLLAAWVRWERDSIHRVYGDFAFAVWDGYQRRLFLVRDYPGNRPLFYHVGSSWVAFASMVKGLHALPGVPLEPNIETLTDHLLLLPPSGSRSFFAHIHRVEPGGLTVVEADGSINNVVWYHPPVPMPEANNPRHLVDQVHEVFTQAVNARLRARRPVAANLSGGLDSGAVVATAAQLLGTMQCRLTAFTHVPLPDVSIQEQHARFGNEGPRARALAAAYTNIDHVLVDSRDRLIADDLAESAYFNEFPSLNLCNNLWITEIARLAANGGHGVMLVGTWGNVTLSYNAQGRLGDLLTSGRLLAWIKDAYALHRRAGLGWRALLATSIRPVLSPAVLKQLRRLLKRPTTQIKDVSALRTETAGYGAFSTFGHNSGLPASVVPRGRVAASMHTLKYQELLTLLRKGLLGRYRVDYRDPFSDRRLLNLCFALPDNLFLRDGQVKWLYQQIFAEVVPEQIRCSPDKGLQSADWWPRLRVSRQVILEELERARLSSTANTLVDLDGIIGAMANMPSTDHVTSVLVETYRLKVLRGLSVAHFLRRFDGGNN